MSDVRQTFRHADLVGDNTVFKIIGHDYRLITLIRYDLGIVSNKDLLTHAEYAQGKWKT